VKGSLSYGFPPLPPPPPQILLPTQSPPDVSDRKCVFFVQFSTAPLSPLGFKESPRVFSVASCLSAQSPPLPLFYLKIFPHKDFQWRELGFRLCGTASSELFKLPLFTHEIIDGAKLFAPIKANPHSSSITFLFGSERLISRKFLQSDDEIKGKFLRSLHSPPEDAPPSFAPSPTFSDLDV